MGLALLHSRAFGGRARGGFHLLLKKDVRVRNFEIRAREERNELESELNAERARIVEGSLVVEGGDEGEDADAVVAALAAATSLADAALSFLNAGEETLALLKEGI